MTTSGNTVYYHYSGDKVVYETDAANNIIAEYTYDPNGNPATMTRNGVTYYYHVNGHGDVVSLTNGSGSVVASYDYDAYGNTLSQSGLIAAINPYRYAGYRYDETTGLYYLMARYYDASIGRFITRDSFHGVEDEPLSLNLYNYAHSNPVMNVDPSGYYPWYIHLKSVVSLIDGLLAFFLTYKGWVGSMVALKWTIIANVMSLKMSAALGQFLLVSINIGVIAVSILSIKVAYDKFIKGILYHLPRGLNPLHKD